MFSTCQLFLEHFELFQPAQKVLVLTLQATVAEIRLDNKKMTRDHEGIGGQRLTHSDDKHLS